MQFSASQPADVSPATTSAHDEGHLFRLSRPNVLLIGPDTLLDAAIAAIVGRPAASVPSWSIESRSNGTEQTVIVRNVMKLDAVEQQRLHQWLDDRAAGVCVIATSPEPVYPMVESEQFLEPLYYRLNMVCVDCCGLERAGRLS